MPICVCEAVYCLQTIAEKKGWELSKSEGFELVTIMPSLVLGPVTGTRPDGTSINAMKVAATQISTHSLAACPCLSPLYCLFWVQVIIAVKMVVGQNVFDLLIIVLYFLFACNVHNRLCIVGNHGVAFRSALTAGNS